MCHGGKSGFRRSEWPLSAVGGGCNQKVVRSGLEYPTSRSPVWILTPNSTLAKPPTLPRSSSPEWLLYRVSSETTALRRCVRAADLAQIDYKHPLGRAAQNQETQALVPGGDISQIGMHRASLAQVEPAE